LRKRFNSINVKCKYEIKRCSPWTQFLIVGRIICRRSSGFLHAYINSGLFTLRIVFLN
jgi:hypothetical protein